MKTGALKPLSFIFVLVMLVLSVGTPSLDAAAQTYCDQAQFIADVTIPDGTSFEKGTPFVKTWRLKNIGSCTWTTGYSLVFSSGEQMGGPDSVSLPSNVAPGQTVDLSVNLTAPSIPGAYRGYWKLKNASGVVFGIGYAASGAFWVDIKVTKPFVTAYDFSADICAATWHYDGGGIWCPYKESAAVWGYALRLDNPTLEDGTAAGRPGILIIPQNKYNSYVKGVYPIMDIFPGDHFQATIGCEGGAVGCYVTYALEYKDATGLRTFWKTQEKYDGRYANIDIDLTSIAWKKKINLVLSVLAYGPASGDRALWVQPRLVRQVDIVPITPTPGPTFTPAPTATSDTKCTDRAKFVADVTVPDWTTFAPNQTFTKTWRLSNVGTCTWTTSYRLVFSGGNKMSGPDFVPFTSSVSPGQAVDLSVNLIAPSTPASYISYWILQNQKGINFGTGSMYTTPIYAAIKVAGTPLPTVTLPSLSTPTATSTLAPTSSPTTAVPTATLTPVPSNVYNNSKYGFTFMLPSNSSLAVLSDNRAHVSLPFSSGTNLVGKYLDVVVVDGLSPCHTTAFTNPPTSSSNVTINGITFLLETGTDSALGNTYGWRSYSTLRNNACIGMNFVLYSTNNGAPQFDVATESSVFESMMATFGFTGP
ncbi:MAG TPA: NBR1-Ig-like domain-containing protein [Anaerolineales bacterium]|nr:NBR1-Ig-like domain-containing protein [Anaerolineales bacterium]